MKTSDPQQLLQSAIIALKVGNKTEGRRLLFQVVLADPKSEAAWLLLSSIMETRYERIDCLEKALNINPENTKARAILEGLLAGPSANVESVPFISPPSAKLPPVDIRSELLNDNNPPSAAQHNTSDSNRQTFTESSIKIGGMSRSQVLTLAILGLVVVVGLIIAGVFILPGLLVAPTPPKKSTQLSVTALSSATPPPVKKTTSTRTSTRLSSATARRSPTAVPATHTPDLSTPTLTLEPAATFLEHTKKIGPIEDLDHNKYTLQIQVTGFRFPMSGSREQPSKGNQFIIIDLTILNLGPDIAPGIGNFGFRLKDNQAVIHNPLLISSASECFMGTADLEAQDSLSGCVAFDAPQIGNLVLIYEPIWNNHQLSISFTIR